MTPPAAVEHEHRRLRSRLPARRERSEMQPPRPAWRGRESSVDAVRRLLFLTSAIVFFDTLFFTALTPLLPHYAHSLGLGKTGAGVLAAAYPAGCLLSAIPSGSVATRLGAKPTVHRGPDRASRAAPSSSGSRRPRGSSTSPASRRASRAHSPGPARSPGSSRRRPARGAGRRSATRSPPRRRARCSARCSARSRRRRASASRSSWSGSARSGSRCGRCCRTPSGPRRRSRVLDAPARAARRAACCSAAGSSTLAALCFGTLGVLAPLWLSALGVGHGRDRRDIPRAARPSRPATTS